MGKDSYITEMLDRFRAGDEEAVKEVYHRYRSKFVGVLYRQYKDNFTIDEIVNEYQECLAMFYEYVVTHPEFSIRSSIDQYLMSMGKNRLYKKYKSRTETVYLDDLPLQTQESWVTDEQLTAGPTTDYFAIFFNILVDYGEPMATILELRIVQGLKYHEISSFLSRDYPGLTPGAIKARVHRVIGVIRARMGGPST